MRSEPTGEAIRAIASLVETTLPFHDSRFEDRSPSVNAVPVKPLRGGTESCRGCRHSAIEITAAQTHIMSTGTSNGPTRSRVGIARNLLLGLAAVIAFTSAAYPQSQPSEGRSAEENAQESKIVTVRAGERYQTSHGGQDWLLGYGYRDLWAAPIEVEVLDLEATAGGLTPAVKVGGLQTLGLALRGEDGRAYTFRSVNKQGLLALPDGFKDSGLEDVIQDQVSSSLPAAELVVASLARAVGVLHAEAKLIVMPDDPRLGEYRELFAGVLGTLYEFPTDGSFGSTDVFGGDDFLERLREGKDRADSHAFLRARLLDLLIGDWDRHYGQWRWARMTGKDRLQPIPEDRDQAFSKYDGLAMQLARAGGGQMTDFQASFPKLRQLAFNGSDFDRILLNDIERDQWIGIAEDVVRRLDDDAIRAAISELPPPYVELRGAELEQTLRARRDQLVDYAAEFYAFLNRKVNVHGTNASDRVLLDRAEDGSLEVRVSLAGEDEPYYQRRFLPDETRSVRIYLHAGEDHVHVDGAERHTIQVRVVSGPDGTVFDAPGRRGVELYEDDDDDGLQGSLTVDVAKRAFSPVLEANWEIQVPGAPYRDWGEAWQPIFTGKWHPDLGLAIGGGLDLKRFGFGRVPWGARHRVSGAYAIGSNNAMASYEGDYRRIGGGTHFETSLFASGLEQLRYHGLGNETSRDGPERYEIAQRQYGAGAFLAWGAVRNPILRFGPIVRFVDSRGTTDDSVLGIEAPYGYERFGQLGLQADLAFDSRTDLPTLSSGFHVDTKASYFPKVWDVEDDYGTLVGSAGAHLQIARPVTVSALFAGKTTWGRFPYFDAAYLGGEDVFSAYNWNRFAGESMVRAGARLRWTLIAIDFAIPGDLGVSLRGDAGRTFVDGEESSLWHSQFQVGVFYAAFDRLLLFEVGVGWSDERTVFTFDADFDWLIR